jgi:hypothetical protein
MTIDELRDVICKACTDYLCDAEWTPAILRHFSGYLFFTLLRDQKLPVTDASVNLRLDGLSVLVRYKCEKPETEVELFYEVKRGGTGFIARLIGLGK